MIHEVTVTDSKNNRPSSKYWAKDTYTEYGPFENASEAIDMITDRFKKMGMLDMGLEIKFVVK